MTNTFRFYPCLLRSCAILLTVSSHVAMADTTFELRNSSIMNAQVGRGAKAELNLGSPQMQQKAMAAAVRPNTVVPLNTHAAADFTNASLDGRQMVKAQLDGVAFINVSAIESDFSHASLKRSRIHNADFSNAKLNGADLREAELVNANFTGADLRGARFDQAKFTNVEWSEADLSDAVWQDGRRCASRSSGRCR